MINEEEQYALFSLDSARRWCKAVIIESERILELDQEIGNLFRNMNSAEAFQTVDWNRMNHISDVSRLEEYYFIIALNKALEWLLESKQKFIEVQPLIERINTELPYIREVRNMREHEIEYFKNEGRNQRNFIRPLGKEGQSIADATSMIVNEEGYFVGGRISVQLAKVIFTEVYNVLESLLHNQRRM